MIESIEKLRELNTFGTVKVDGDLVATNMLMVCATKEEINEIADEIEAEIAERYMELPCDADGVPIQCGDTVSGGMGDSGKVQHVEIWPDGFVVVYEHQPGQFTRYSNGAVHHVNPCTIEDVLADFASKQHGITTEENDALIAKCAAEIRELMEVDE